MKYVVFLGEFGIESPVVFPETVNHSAFKPLGKIISAGFVSFTQDSKTLEKFASCWGESTSIGVKSRMVEDSELITRMIEKY